MIRDGNRLWVVLAVVCSIMILTAIALSLFFEPELEPVPEESPSKPGLGRGLGRGLDQPMVAPGENRDSDQQNVTFTAPWGSAPGELGRRVPEEGAPEGPMSFTVAEDGRVYVLDQINQRVQIFKDGKFDREIKIPGDTFQDLGVNPNGRIVLLDRLAQKTLLYLEPEQRVALEGPRVPEGGGVTGLFLHDDGAWVEVEHQKLVRIADASGNADPQRPWVDGRHSADGAWLLLAALDGRNAVNITLKPIDSAGSPVVRRAVFDEKILFLTALESDPEGNVFLGARLEKAEMLVIISPDGTEVGRVALPVPAVELEQFRALRMGNDGGIYQLHFTDPGATLRRIEW